MFSASPALSNPTLVAPNFVLREHVRTLHSHLHQCSRARGWWFSAAALGEQIHVWVAPRLISTVTGAVFLLGLIALWA